MLPSDPTAFKILQVPSGVLAVLGLYSRSIGILKAVEFSVALSNYYLKIYATAFIYWRKADYHIAEMTAIFCDL